MYEQKKKMSNAKLFALVISIGLHVVVFYYLGKMALDYALPKGEVSSYEVDFNANGIEATPAPVVEETAVAPVEPPPPTPPPVTPPPPAPKKVAAPPAPKPVAALPTKEVTEAPVEDHQGTVPVAVETAESIDSTDIPVEETPQVDPFAAETKEVAPEVAQQPVAEVPPPVAAPESGNATEAPQTLALGTTPGVQSDSVLMPMATNKSFSYPMIARMRKLEGVAVVHYTVSASGVVTDIKVMQSSGHASLDNQAVDTIKNWKFKPTGKDGVYERPVRFSLVGDAKEAPSKLRRLGK